MLPQTLSEINIIFHAYFLYLNYLNVFGYPTEFITLDKVELFINSNTLIDMDELEKKDFKFFCQISESMLKQFNESRKK